MHAGEEDVRGAARFGLHVTRGHGVFQKVKAVELEQQGRAQPPGVVCTGKFDGARVKVRVPGVGVERRRTRGPFVCKQISRWGADPGTEVWVTAFREAPILIIETDELEVARIQIALGARSHARRALVGV